MQQLGRCWTYICSGEQIYVPSLTPYSDILLLRSAPVWDGQFLRLMWTAWSQEDLKTWTDVCEAHRASAALEEFTHRAVDDHSQGQKGNIITDDYISQIFKKKPDVSSEAEAGWCRMMQNFINFINKQTDRKQAWRKTEPSALVNRGNLGVLLTEGWVMALLFPSWQPGQAPASTMTGWSYGGMDGGMGIKNEDMKDRTHRNKQGNPCRTKRQG